MEKKTFVTRRLVLLDSIYYKFARSIVVFCACIFTYELLSATFPLNMDEISQFVMMTLTMEKQLRMIVSGCLVLVPKIPVECGELG